MNRNRARIDFVKKYLLKKKITIHGCDTSMVYPKMGPLAAYRFKGGGRGAIFIKTHRYLLEYLTRLY